MRKWLVLIFPLTLSGIVASCGSDDSSIFGNGGNDSGSGDDSTQPPPLYDASGDGSNHGPCKPKSCADQGFTCGPNTDGCGDLIDCGNCTAPAFCGGGGFSKCGGNANVLDGGTNCVPGTCASEGIQCGKAGDGCGGLVNGGQPCGTCTPPQICGGGGTPSVCGDSNLDGGGDAGCTGLCTQQVNCDGGVTTTISGT